MKIVAFLQNMWVYPRSLQSVIRFEPTSDERERMISYALFAGCTTGKRLKSTLGEELCSRIVWQEASPVVATNPKDYFPPDPVHIRAVLNKHRPQIVISLTKPGGAVIHSLLDSGVVFVPGSHPCARGADTLLKLRTIAAAINGLLSTEAA